MRAGRFVFDCLGLVGGRIGFSPHVYDNLESPHQRDFRPAATMPESSREAFPAGWGVRAGIAPPDLFPLLQQAGQGDGKRDATNAIHKASHTRTPESRLTTLSRGKTRFQA